ncbi:MAG: RluA family pseudouridine synthase [Candidatus Omnitrophota bacterium]
MQQHTLKVSLEDAGKRLDIYLLEFFQQQNMGLSRTFIQKLLKENQVTSNGVVAIKAHHKVNSGDEIIVSIGDKKINTLEPEDIPLEIVYQDADVAVINKPAGLVVHPAPGNYAHTLVNALLYHFKELSDINPLRPGIVHRLDKDASGLLVVARNNRAHLILAEQFSAHSVKRKYIAIVKGKMEFDQNMIELPIARHALKRKSMAVSFSKAAKYAKTYYRTLKRSKDYSVVELELFTGRTHQIRVHLAFLGHPILGDNKYGKHDAFPRLALHAKSIGFLHPSSGKFVEFSSELPKEFKNFVLLAAL